jgi:hypothetical protein
MSITYLTEEADEESSYFVTASFEDEDGDATTPDSITYSLTDEYGTVINSLEDEVVTPASSITIVLTGDDLSIQSSERKKEMATRLVTIVAQYDSQLQNNISLTGVAIFPLRNHRKVT